MRYASLLMALPLVACAPVVEAGASPAVAQVEAPSIEQFGQLVASGYVEPFKAGDVETWLAIFDEDAVGLHNRMPAMEGKQALRGFASFVRDNLVVAEMSVTLDGMRHDGGLAYTWGRFRSRLLMKDTGEPMPGHSENGKVLFVWKRQGDGSWKIAVDMGNAVVDPTAPN